MNIASKKRFRLGDRVKMGALFGGVVPYGTTGTVAQVAGVRGKSIYPDPLKLMVFVEWDNGRKSGDFRKFIDRVR